MKVAAIGEDPIVYDVPNEKILLRYLNSISVKYNEQYANWLKKRTVSDKDAFVIAVNPGEMGDDFQLAPNPHARVPFPEGFRLRGMYYEAKTVEGGYDVTPVRADPGR